jgi:hypothetical protein
VASRWNSSFSMERDRWTSLAPDSFKDRRRARFSLMIALAIQAAPHIPWKSRKSAKTENRPRAATISDVLSRFLSVFSWARWRSGSLSQFWKSSTEQLLAWFTPPAYIPKTGLFAFPIFGQNPAHLTIEKGVLFA